MKKTVQRQKQSKAISTFCALPIAIAISMTFAPQAKSYTTFTAKDLDGNPFAEVLIHEVDDAFEFSEQLATGEAIRQMTHAEIQSIASSLGYLASVFGQPAYRPTLYYFALDPADGNAASYPLTDSQDQPLLMSVFQGKTDARQAPLHALVSINQTKPFFQWYTEPVKLLIQNGRDENLTSALTHELFHSLGVMSTMVEYQEQGMKLGSTSSPWEMHLKDVYGNAHAPSKLLRVVSVEDAKNPSEGQDDTVFTVLHQDSNSGISFQGENVSKALKNNYQSTNSADKTLIYYSDETIVEGNTLVAAHYGNSVSGGIPVNGFQYLVNKRVDRTPVLELSHIELQNSFMSHQTWRNWGTPMEAELAAMNDIGYNIDLKRFFGTSVYESGNRGITINRAFTARMDGNWSDQASLQPWAIGTHIYGSLNHVTVAADQLANGDTSIGLRVDGVKNTLVVSGQTLVSANGEEGIGIAFTYGRDHTLEIEEGAEVSATGENGRALSFDFGSNLLSDYVEYRGSWTRSQTSDGLVWNNEKKPLLDSINGYLVTEARIDGKVTAGNGGYAVYIAPNASVKKITVGKTAEITGDIISLWNAQTRVQDNHWVADHPIYRGLTTKVAQNTDLTTELTLDAATYHGNILGENGIRLTVGSTGETMTASADTVTTFNGVAKVLGVTIKPGAVLSGAGTFVLTPQKDGNTFARVPDNDSFTQETFVNDGKLVSSPVTGTAYIVGNYQQGQSASLVVGIDGEGNLHGLGVTGDVTFENGANIGLIPSGYFKSGTVSAQNAQGSPITGREIQGNFTYGFEDASSFQDLSSTLIFTVNDDKSDLTVTRKANAYSQHLQAGAPTWQRQLASILDRNAESVTNRDAQTLIANLDYSTGTGIADTISGLGGDAHLMSVRSHFALERLLDRTLTFAHQDPAPDGKFVWLQPFGGKISERFIEGNADSDIAGVAGGVTTRNQNLTVGWNLAAAYMKSNDSVGGQSRTEGLWFAGSVKDFPANNGTWFIEGNARLGVMNSKTERTIERLSDKKLETEGMRYSVSAMAQVGAQFDLASIELAPVAGFAATALRTPSDTEKGIGGLDIQSQWYKSIRARLGLKASTAYLPSQIRGYSWKWHAYATYERELTDETGNFRSTLNGMSGAFERSVTFNDKNHYLAGISLGLYNETGFSASFRFDSEMSHGMGSAVTGSAQLRWKF